MKKILIVLSVAVLAACSNQQSVRIGNDGKAQMSVLYVGGQPNIETMGTRVSPEAVAASVTERMASFEKFLNEKFSAVTVVKADDYKPEMSDAVDVTIFDGKPPVLEPGHSGYDFDGEMVSIPAKRLPWDFDRAAITIASMGEAVAVPIGSKNDWYCLCLDADAHHWVEDHPIFHGPFPVTLTTVMKPTPEDAKHYDYFYDSPLPDSTLMWRVQKNGYLDTPNALVGMVARPWGYVEANDSEYISSGVCAKTIDAVAIGRHGNFFHWGFAADPNGLTEEGRQVFANAIVYMAAFNGTKMLVRKVNERISTREYVKEEKYLATMEPYEERVGWTLEANEEGVKKQAEVRKKKARGEALSREDEYYLNFKPETPMTLDEYLIRYESEAYEVLGADLSKYNAYYDENLPYFYGGKGSYTLPIDEDCKAWGIDNHDTALLDKAISCLEKGEDVERAQRILERYTMCSFTSPKEWRAWFDKYRSKMFFTEAGGWVFLINGPSGLPGNDYRVRQEKAKAAEEAAMQQISIMDTPTYDNPVCTAALWNKDKKQIELSFSLYKGFHVYRTVGTRDPYIPLSVEASAPRFMVVEEPVFPHAHAYGSAGTMVYDDDFTVIVPVGGRSEGPVTIKVGWQSCDDKMCTPPQTREFKVMARF